MFITNLPAPAGPNLDVLTHNQVLDVLHEHGRLRSTGSLQDALADPETWPNYLWTGQVPGDDAGRYWIPALFPARNLPGALRELAERRKAAGKAHDIDSCIDTMTRFHSGLGKAQVGVCPWAYVEIDHLPRFEQERRYAELAEATGLRWALQVFTGGKSVHAYLAFSQPLVATDPLRERIQRLLVVCLEGDTRIVDAARLMRLPGWRGARIQPVVHFEPDAVVEAEVVEGRLSTYARALGIEDVEGAYATLQLAERLEVQARQDADDGNTELAHDLREHADLLRRTRGNASEADLTTARSMLWKAGPVLVDGASQATPRVRELHVAARNDIAREVVAADTMVHLADGRLVRLDEAPEDKTAAHCPLHPDTTPSAFVRRLAGGRGLLHCSVCGTFLTAPERIDHEAVDAVVDAVVVANPSPVDTSSPALEPDTVPSLRSRVEARVGELLLDVPFGCNASIDDFVRSSLSGDIRDCNGQNAESSASNAHEPSNRGGSVDDAEVDAVRVRLRALGDALVRCEAGPWSHRAGDGSDGRSAKLACLRYGCPICGPRVVRVLRAAAEVVVGSVVERGGWSGVVVSNLSDTADRALRRWASQVEPKRSGVEPDAVRRARLQMEPPPRRLHLTIARTPSRTTTVVLWKGTEHAPSGALSRHLHGADQVEDASDAAGKMVAEVNLKLWGKALDRVGNRRRATVLRGCDFLTERIADLRDAVLGRSRSRDKSQHPGVSIQSYLRSGADVRAEVARRLETAIDAHEPERHRAGARVEHWRVTDGSPVAMVLGQMEDDGWFDGRGWGDDVISLPDLRDAAELDHLLDGIL